MKIKRLFALILLIVLVLSGCSDEETAPSESRKISALVAESVIEDTTIPPTETKKIIPNIEEKSESKTEISTPADTEKETPTTDISQTETVSQAPTTTVSDTTNIPEITPETVPPSNTEPPEKEVQETMAEEISHPTKPTVDIDFYITYAKDFAKNIGLKYDSTATDCWDNPITANENTERVIADIESRLTRYKNIEGFEYICIWYEKVVENKFEIYIGYA